MIPVYIDNGVFCFDFYMAPAKETLKAQLNDSRSREHGVFHELLAHLLLHLLLLLQPAALSVLDQMHMVP